MKINGNLYAIASLTVPYPSFPGVANTAQVPKIKFSTNDKILVILPSTTQNKLQVIIPIMQSEAAITSGI